MSSKVNDEIELFDFVVAVRNTILFILSKWLKIVLLAILFGILGIVYAYFKKPIYVSETTFVTENSGNDKFSSYASIAAQFGFDLGTGNGGAFEGENLIEFFKSKNIITKTLLSKEVTSNQLYIDLYIQNYHLNNGWEKKPQFKNIKFNTSYNANSRICDSILNIIYKKISKGSLDIVKKDKKLNYFTIQLRDENESFAKGFLETLLKNGIEFYTSYKVKKAQSNVDILQNKTDSVKALLISNVYSVGEINDFNINPIKQIVKIPVQKKQIDQQVNAALYNELFKNLELAKLSLIKETPLIQIIDASRYPLQVEKQSKLITGILFSITAAILYISFLFLQNWYRKALKAN
jgi:hypothetical protein